jgi:membrane protease YdiL (CAAX protease family)
VIEADEVRPPEGALRNGLLLLALTFGFTFALPLLNLTGLSGAVKTLIAEGLYGVMVLLLCRPVVRAAGGWDKAIGLRRPRLNDVGLALVWTVVEFVARIAVVIVLVAFIPSLLHRDDVSNIRGIEHATDAQVAVVIVAAVFMAPLLEEIAFRGLLLRGLTPKLGFGWTAVLTSLAFGLLHGHEGVDLTTAFVTVVLTGAFGFLQAVLVQWRKTLTPAVLTHMLSNALALTIALNR